MAFKPAFAVLTVALFSSIARADDWPGWLGPQRDGVWRETGILEKFPDGGPKVNWRVPVGEGYSGPAVVGDKVYITDRILTPGAKNPASAFDRKTRVDGKERILCLEEATGKLLWKHEYDCPYRISYASGPRTTPIVQDGKVWTLGSMGDLFCLDANSGKVLWHREFMKDYTEDVPGWGWSATPIIDGQRLICLVGGKGSTAVAFDKDTGKEIWKNLTAKEPGYAPPMIFDLAGKKQVIIWHPESVNSLDPVTGKLNWTQAYPDKKFIKAGLTVPSPRAIGNLLYVTAFYDGHMLLRINENNQPEVVYRSKGRSEQPEETDGLHSIMPTPFIKDSHIYGVCSYGELRCLDLKTGERKWSTLEATTNKSVRWGNAFLVQHEDRFFLFNEKGDLIIAKLTPKGYEEISRARIVEATNTMAPGRPVVWSHPAFAHRNAYIRNDKELVSISLAK